MSTMDSVLAALLTVLGLNDAIVREVIAETSVAETYQRTSEGPIELELLIDGPEDYMPLTPLRATAVGGMFLIMGRNNRGKTTALLHASVLLGVDWQDESFLKYLREERRYAEAGRRFQSDLERGLRSASMTLTQG